MHWMYSWLLFCKVLTSYWIDFEEEDSYLTNTVQLSFFGVEDEGLTEDIRVDLAVDVEDQLWTMAVTSLQCIKSTEETHTKSKAVE